MASIRKPARGIFGGNFWAASCDHIQQLPRINNQPPSSYAAQQKKKQSQGCFDAEEEVFGSLQKADENTTKYVSLHQPTPFYYRLMEPSEYASAIANWGPNV